MSETKRSNVRSLPNADQAKDLTGIGSGPPQDLAKLAVWRNGIQQPLTFEVTEETGRQAMRQFTEGLDVGFGTYDHAGTGRVSTSYFQRAELSGLTLEVQTDDAPRIALG